MTLSIAIVFSLNFPSCSLMDVLLLYCLPCNL